MKCIYEHDEEDDFIEIHLTEKDLNALSNDRMLELAYPAMLHSRRKTNLLIRSAENAIEQRQQPKSNSVKCKKRN